MSSPNSGINDDYRPYWLELQNFTDDRGALTVVEGGSDLPFAIARLYWLTGTPEGRIRGEHAHKTLEQLFTCLAGRLTLIVDDGQTEHRFDLDDPSKGVYVPPGCWRELSDFAPGTVVLVAVSAPFSEEDYIRDREGFRVWVTAGRP